MINLIKKFLAYFLPFLKEAVAETIADTLDDWLFDEHRRNVQKHVRYERLYNGRSRPQKPSNSRLFTPLTNFTPVSDERPEGGYHDVLMVAFSIHARSEREAHEWLQTHLPATGAYVGQAVEIDEWWIADDHRLEDIGNDSAVFVKEGAQAEARELLRKHGLAWS